MFSLSICLIAIVSIGILTVNEFEHIYSFWYLAVTVMLGLVFVVAFAKSTVAVSVTVYVFVLSSYCGVVVPVGVIFVQMLLLSVSQVRPFSLISFALSKSNPEMVAVAIF